MKHICCAIAAGALILLLAGCSSEPYTMTQHSHRMPVDSARVMKIQDVIAMSKAGVSDSIIVGMMDATNSWFQLKTQDVLDLRNAGVSERVIGAMMEQPAQQTAKEDNSALTRYYVYQPYYWYGGWYPYWHYPSFSMRFGYLPHHPEHIRPRRSR